MNHFPGPGDRFGRYTIDRQLGRGGMGVVYAGHDTLLGRPVALKVMHPWLSGDAESRDRFAREAATLARIDSPMIVQIYDSGEIDGFLYLVTQLITQGDLHVLLYENGPLDVQTALELCHDVCEALSDAHAVGVVHRDVKPSNVFLRTRGNRLTGLLGDFGIATSDDSHVTKTGTVIGSTGYMAPERHRGARADERADIYSVGCLLWMCLTGSAPYTGTDVQVAMAHMNDPIPQLDDGRPGQSAVNTLLSRAMAKDPADRYATAADMAAALNAAQRSLQSGDAVGDPLSSRTTIRKRPARPGAAQPAGRRPSPAYAPSYRPPTVASSSPPSGPQSGPASVVGTAPDRSSGRLPLLVGAVLLALVLMAGVVAVIVLLARGGEQTSPPRGAHGRSNAEARAKYYADERSPNVVDADGGFKAALYDSLARTTNGFELGKDQAHCVGNKLLVVFGEQELKSLGITSRKGEVALDPSLSSDQAWEAASPWIQCDAVTGWAWASYYHPSDDTGLTFDDDKAEACLQRRTSTSDVQLWMSDYWADETSATYDRVGSAVRECVKSGTRRG